MNKKTNLIAVALIPDTAVRHCTPVELRLVDGKVTEMYALGDSEEVAYSLARAQARFEQYAEEFAANQWPPDCRTFEMAEAAKNKLSKPTVLRIESELPESIELPSKASASVRARMTELYVTWRRSVQPAITELLKRHDKTHTRLDAATYDEDGNVDTDQEVVPISWLELVEVTLEVTESLHAWHCSAHSLTDRVYEDDEDEYERQCLSMLTVPKEVLA